MRRFHRPGSGPYLLLSLMSALIGSYVLIRAISRAAKKAVRKEAREPGFQRTNAAVKGCDSAAVKYSEPVKAEEGSTADQEPPDNGSSREIPEPQPPGGTVFIRPEADCVVPFTVDVKDTCNYYIYLKFLKLPDSAASTPWPDTLRSDIGFFAAANAAVSLKVPVGVFSLMYASGMEWRGPAEKFGPDTKYYTAAQTLTFYKDGNHLYGNTVQLFPQTGGNDAYHQIDPSEFPV